MSPSHEGRRAAGRYAAELVDAAGFSDPNMERERQLVEDEYFQGLAVAAKELDVLDVYGDASESHAGRFADTARQNLALAMEERAEEVLETAVGRSEVTA